MVDKFIFHESKEFARIGWTLAPRQNRSSPLARDLVVASSVSKTNQLLMRPNIHKESANDNERVRGRENTQYSRQSQRLRQERCSR